MKINWKWGSVSGHRTIFWECLYTLIGIVHMQYSIAMLLLFTTRLPVDDRPHTSKHIRGNCNRERMHSATIKRQTVCIIENTIWLTNWKRAAYLKWQNWAFLNVAYYWCCIFWLIDFNCCLCCIFGWAYSWSVSGVIIFFLNLNSSEIDTAFHTMSICFGWNLRQITSFDYTIASACYIDYATTEGTAHLYRILNFYQYDFEYISINGICLNEN